MIQVSDFIAMFAVSQTKRYSYMEFAVGYFYVREVLVSKNIRLSNPCFLPHSICSSLLVEMGGDSLSYAIFQISEKLMTKRNEICNAVNNSTRTATSAHETCTFLTSFQTLETLIPQLHEDRIRFRKNRVKGVFNITGRYTTMSAPTMEQLISNVLEKQREYRRYIDENRKQKILNHELR